MMDWEDSEHDSDDVECDSDETENDSDEMEYEYLDDDMDRGDSEYNLKRMKSDGLEIKNDDLRRIASILKEISGDTVHFFGEDELCCKDIAVKVDGIGGLTFPLKDDCIEKLISISTKARFGKGEETILNEDVRDTHEIPGRKLNVIIKQESFTRMLDKMRSEMGFSDNCVLETELHNMLIYSRGQFFDLHQDTEKADNMIGTLVIILPSPHIGGDLIIQHGTKTHTFSSENLAYKDFKCVAFYADCKHKIEKVKEGFRIALTYKLILKTKQDQSIDRVNKKLENAIQKYFSDLQTHSKMYVYFLDHSYTEHSLKWNMLKGEDCIRSNALLAVGKSLNLTPHLAFVDVQQQWCNGDDYQMENPIPLELNEITYSLSHWINSNNEKQLFKEHFVAEVEICWTKETTASFKPLGTDCSGYTGNEGFTVDYSYKRAAVVLWQSSRDLVMKLILNPEGAFKELQATMESPGKETEVKGIVKEYGDELYSKCRNEKADFEKMNQIALYINDRKAALPILSHFNWSILDCDISKSLAKVESQYGSAWCIELLNKWKSKEVKSYYSFYSNEVILKNLKNFVETYVNSEGTSEVVKIILDEQFSNISSTKNFENYSSEKLKDVIDILYDYIISCTVIENTELIDKVIQYLVSSSPILLSTYLADLYIKLREAILSNYLSNCEPLKIYLISSIKKELESVTESLGNWSVKNQLKCQCNVCQEVNSFLRSHTDMKKEWKPLKKHRDHLNVQLKKVNLPVTLSVEATGRPQKVTLVKKESMHCAKRSRIKELQLVLKKLGYEG